MKVILTDVVVTRAEANEWFVLGHDADGREYTHEVVFADDAAGAALMRRVEAADGAINDERWFMWVPYGSNAWLDDGYEEATMMEERYGGLGEGTELAHVW